MFKKYFRNFPNNILGVSHEKMFSKCNEYDFLTFMFMFMCALSQFGII